MRERVNIPEGWEEKKLLQIAKIISGTTPNTDVSEYWGNDFIWLTPNDLKKENNLNIISSQRMISKKGINTFFSNLIPRNAIVISSRAPIGYVGIVRENYVTNQGCKSLIFNDTQSPEYHYYNIKHNVNQLRLLSTGTTFEEIAKKDLENSSFIVPKSKKEQEKIAEILSEVDSAIEYAQSLHVKHQKIKAALMQDLLTHGIDSNGKIRNPKTHTYKPSPLGDIPVEWDVKEIGKIYKELRTGSTPSRAIPDYFKGDILWVTSGELKYKPIYDTIEKITKEAVRATNLKIYPSGTFFIAITGLEAEGTRGSCAIIAKEATTNQSCMAFEKNDQIDTHFLFQYYKLHGKYISLLYSQGSKQQSLNNKIVSKILIHLPPKEEQQKIAQILSSNDEKIEKVKTKLEKLQQLKTALMQDLLSGTKRVNHLLGEEQ